MTFRPARRSGSEINLTPLIDIMFTVLLFLVLSATFTEQTVVRIVLPRAATSTATSTDTHLVRILVDVEGRMYLDGHVATLDDVKGRLAAIADVDRAFVTISADENARHGRVVQIVDLIRQAGIFRLDIETIAGAESQ
jgi:biopolymer transport protein ExbD